MTIAFAGFVIHRYRELAREGEKERERVEGMVERGRSAEELLLMTQVSTN